MDSIKPKWIGSAGGPCAIINSVDLELWSGTGEISEIKKGIFKEAEDFMDPEQAHYGVACDNDEEYITKVQVEGFSDSVIIIGDEPAGMKFTEVGADGTFYLVKWGAGETEEEFESFMKLENFQNIDGWDDNFELKIIPDKNNFILMDSAICGMTYSREDDADNFFEFSINPGQYSISTVEYSPNDDTRMLIHRFEKQNKSL